MKQFSTISRLLIFFLRNPNAHLPETVNLSPRNWNLLLRLAKYNKMIPFLRHLLLCPSCNQKLTKSAQRNLKGMFAVHVAMRIIHDKEKQILTKTLKRRKIKVVFPKDFSKYNLYPKNTFPSFADIDILANQKDAKQLEKIFLSLDYTFFKRTSSKPYIIPGVDFFKALPFGRFYLDLHFQALPSTSGGLNPLPQEIVNKITKSAFKNTRENSSFELSLEYSLLLSSLHYFFRDNCRGLRNIYTISRLVELYPNKVDWKLLFKKVDEFRLRNYFVFIMRLGNSLFGLKEIKPVTKKTTKAARLAHFLYHPLFVTRVLSKNEGHSPKKCQESKIYFFFISIILTPKPFLWKLLFLLKPHPFYWFWRYFLPTLIKTRIFEHAPC